jgi:hypothetical protein
MTKTTKLALLASGAFALAGMIGTTSCALAQDGSTLRLAESQKAVTRSAPKRVVAPRGGGAANIGRTRAVETRRPVVNQRAIVNQKAVVNRPTTVVRGGGLRAVGHGPGGVVFHGRNFSVWRGGPYRIRYGAGYRTFVALSALSVIAVGGAAYYPYAYVAAPQPLCEGETDEGCVLQWDEVPTVEGDTALQCVAYCPWQQ